MSDLPILNADQLAVVYNWIDGVTFTRPRKDISRDFSDGVLCAELIAKFLPRLVELHNYSPSSNSKQKKDNWETLNRKVLSKIRYHVSPDTVSKLIASKPGIVESVLWGIKYQVEVQVVENPSIGPKSASKSSSIASVGKVISSRYGQSGISQPLTPTTKKWTPKTTNSMKNRPTLGLVSEASDHSEDIEEKSHGMEVKSIEVQGRPTEVQVLKNSSIIEGKSHGVEVKSIEVQGRPTEVQVLKNSSIIEGKSLGVEVKSIEVQGRPTEVQVLKNSSIIEEKSLGVEVKSIEVQGRPTEVQVLKNSSVDLMSDLKSTSSIASARVKKVVSSSRYGYNGIDFSKSTPKEKKRSALGLVSAAGSETSNQSEEIEDKSNGVEIRFNEVKGRQTEAKVVKNPSNDPKSASKSSSIASARVKKVVSSSRYGYNGIDFNKKPKKWTSWDLLSESESSDDDSEENDETKERSNGVKGMSNEEKLKPIGVQEKLNEDQRGSDKNKAVSRAEAEVRKILDDDLGGLSEDEFVSHAGAGFQKILDDDLGGLSEDEFVSRAGAGFQKILDENLGGLIEHKSVSSAKAGEQEKLTGIQSGASKNKSGQSKVGSLNLNKALEKLYPGINGLSVHQSKSLIAEMITDVQEGLMRILELSRDKSGSSIEEEVILTEDELKELETTKSEKSDLGWKSNQSTVSATKKPTEEDFQLYSKTTSGSFIPIAFNPPNELDDIDDYPYSFDEIPHLSESMNQITTSSAHDTLFYKILGPEPKSGLDFTSFLSRKSSMDLSYLNPKNFNQFVKKLSPIGEPPRFEVSTILPPQKTKSSTDSISDAEGILEVLPSSSSDDSSMESINLNSDEEIENLPNPIKQMDSSILDEVVDNQELIEKKFEEKDEEIKKLNGEIAGKDYEINFFTKLTEIKDGRIRRLAHENSRLQSVISELEKEKNSTWYNWNGKK